MQEKPWSPIYVQPLPELFKLQALDLYVHALEEKLTPILGPPSESLDFLREQVELAKGIVALSPEPGSEQVVGILGLQDHQGGFLCPDEMAILDRYGLVSGLYKLRAMMALDPELQPGQLYLDGVAVMREWRGRGIGRRLIGTFEAYGRAQGFTTAILEVIDTNPRAQQLYTQLGYRTVSTRSLAEWREIFPFRASIRMEKSLRSC